MQIAFVGMGEAGAAIVGGWGAARAAQVRTYDIKTDDPAKAAEIADRCAVLGIRNCPTLAEAVESADLVFCTVTADQAGLVARQGAAHLAKDAYWFDLNSCAPSTKQASSKVIDAAGGRYVDVAVMAPVHPGLNMVPCLISGPYAAEAAGIMADLPMSIRVIDGAVGAASSIKMIRSVMVKGLEALTTECALAAIAAGVEDEVFGSLGKSYPGIDWPARAAYNFERMVVHGTRRAAEMEEVARTLSDLGLYSDVTDGTILWQRRLAGSGVAAPDETAFKETGQALLAALRKG